MYVYATGSRPFVYPLGVHQNPYRGKNGAKPIIKPWVSNKKQTLRNLIPVFGISMKARGG